MRILFTATRSTDQQLNGLTLFAESLAAGLSSEGHACALFVSDAHHHPAQAELKHAEVRGLPVFRAALPEPRTVDEALDQPGAVELFRQATHAFRPDLVHFHALQLLSARMLEAARDAGLPTIVTLHDYYPICPAIRLLRMQGGPCPGPDGGRRCGSCLAATGHLTGRYRGFWRWLKRRWDVKARRRYARVFEPRFELMKNLLAGVDVIVCPSNYLGDRMVRAGMIDGYEVVPNGSELEPLPRREAAGPPVLGMLAYHSYAKGTVLLLDALKTAPDLALRLEIHGAGDPRYLAAVRNRARRDERVSVEGAFSQADLPRILAGLDALVLPSIWAENAPLVVLDALAAGRPCVVPTDCGAVESIADGRHGLLFARGSVSSLAAALKRLTDDEEVLRRFHDNILNDRPVITRAEAVAHYAVLYRRVAGGQHKLGPRRKVNNDG